MRAKLVARLVMSVAVITVGVGAAFSVMATENLSVNANLAAVAPVMLQPLANTNPARPLVGVFERKDTQSWSVITGFQKTIGSPPNIVSSYVPFGGRFDHQFVGPVDAHDAYPLLQLLPRGTVDGKKVTLGGIYNGFFNKYLRYLARAVKAWKSPVIISFGPEADGTWEPWGRGHPTESAGSWRRAYRYVVKRFRKLGVRNVTWLWTMNILPEYNYRVTYGYTHLSPVHRVRWIQITNAYTPRQIYEYINRYWPRSNNDVDWVGIDGYLANPGMTFQNSFDPTLTVVRSILKSHRISRPIFLSEVGADTTDNMAYGIDEFFQAVKQNRLKGLLYFDVNQPDHKHWWRIEGHTKAIREFRKGLCENHIWTSKRQGCSWTPLYAPHKIPTGVAPSPLPKLDFTTNRYLGVFKRAADHSWSSVSAFAKRVGERPRIVSTYVRWGDRFELSFADRAVAHGAVPLFQVLPEGRFLGHAVTLAAIAKDAHHLYDPYLRRFAEKVKRWGDPVILAFAPDPNAKDTPWGYRHYSPSTWLAAYRRVLGVFRHVGVHNATWLWTINQSADTKRTLSYWPGGEDVGCVGVDGYIVSADQTAKGLFASTIADVRHVAPNKPIFLSDAGVNRPAGLARGVRELFQLVVKDQLAGLLYFDINQRDGHRFWKIDRFPDAVAAFKHGLREMNAQSHGVASSSGVTRKANSQGNRKGKLNAATPTAD